MRILIAGLSALFLFPYSATAELSGMDLQRCIWQCLAGTPGPDSPQYNACVAEHCTEGGQPGAQDPSRHWQTGRTADGTAYAGVDAPGRSGTAGVYYFCRGGSGWFAIIEPDQAVGGPLRFVVDGRAFDLRFGAWAGGRAEAAVPPGAPLIAALRGGSRFEVQTPGGGSIYTLSLNGSGRALGQAAAGCQP